MNPFTTEDRYGMMVLQAVYSTLAYVADDGTVTYLSLIHILPEDGRDADACTFMPRCPLATSACSHGVPPWEADGASRGGHRCACRHPWKIEAGEVPR